MASWCFPDSLKILERKRNSSIRNDEEAEPVIHAAKGHKKHRRAAVEEEEALNEEDAEYTPKTRAYEARPHAHHPVPILFFFDFEPFFIFLPLILRCGCLYTNVVTMYSSHIVTPFVYIIYVLHFRKQIHRFWGSK